MASRPTLKQIQARRKRVRGQVTSAKVDTAKAIAKLIDDANMTQTEAAYVCGDAPSQISLVVTGKLRGFSMERLILLRAMLADEIELRIAGVKLMVG